MEKGLVRTAIVVAASTNLEHSANDDQIERTMLQFDRLCYARAEIIAKAFVSKLQECVGP